MSYFIYIEKYNKEKEENKEVRKMTLLNKCKMILYYLELLESQGLTLTLISVILNDKP